ncbi:cofactor synthesis protein [Palaeococcus pacificus DY20341]|uniref:Cofactor synthesis protein n=1 Tax=Palaeococcus pacificus DY20341 TaxID=1343739 RepID=A0A075LW31_9EURY|nr:radical SAM protein [Palaeococcus pacificus]AIF70416.1 cofactor synthesis protein [Palaeococcus pacificus DY20341]
MKYSWEEFARKMGVEPQILENKEARLLKKFVDELIPPTHCQGCQGLDLSIENPVHHPSYELTPACNHNCIFCYSNVAVKLGKAPKPGYYGWDNPKAITVSQYGEPLMSPKIVEVNKMLRERFPDARLDLQTNGSLLTEELWAKLDFDLVMISLDAASREKHLKITNADTFDDVVNALRIVGRDKSVRSIVRTIFMPGINDEDIPKIAELAASLGIDEMMLQPLTVHYHNHIKLDNAGLDFERAESIADYLKAAMEAKKFIDVRISGCQLVQYKKMDALTLWGAKRVARDVAPIVKRERKDSLKLV